MRYKRDLSQTEYQIMNHIWQDGTGGITAGEVREEFNGNHGKHWKKQTVSTYMSRLVDAGYLYIKESGSTYTYFPTMPESEKVVISTDSLFSKGLLLTEAFFCPLINREKKKEDRKETTEKDMEYLKVILDTLDSDDDD